MQKKYKKLVIGLAILIMVFGVRIYFSNISKSEADMPALSSSNDTSGSLAKSTALNYSNDKIAQDTAFLSTLTSLTRIKIDPSLFTNNSFNALKDNEVTIDLSGKVGRINPFATIDVSISSGAGLDGSAGENPQIFTSQEADVTATTATLNGITSTLATQSYFEYGANENLLDKITPSTNLLTLVGSFSAKISGLKPKTVYFFRAVSKISGSLVRGNVLSFTTK